jgi:hypothetical protein
MKGYIDMKFLDLVKKCEEVAIDCDKCQHQKECSQFTAYLEDASPIMIAKLVQENQEL